MIDQEFQKAYNNLESKFKILAEKEGNVCVPNPRPIAPVDYVFICMEPSFGKWAKSNSMAESKIADGFLNFLNSMEDFLLHYCANTYLCNDGEHYHITDISKGAMLVKNANIDRNKRYDKWYPVLREELELVAKPGARIITVGRKVSEFLNRKSFEISFTNIIHYSGQAAKARNDGIKGNEESFNKFKDEVTKEHIISNAEKVLKDSRISDKFYNETMARLKKRKLTTSRKKLIFIYKQELNNLAFRHSI
ncbi:MAG TPA: hypothetical protein VKA34_13760 [Balneolales bacterium]|nr:hypothetical protein [Balneolales bacterium]